MDQAAQQQAKVEDELNCLGFFGFGGGYLFAKPPGRPDSYCNTCVRHQECWDKHRERVAREAPEAVKYFLEMVDTWGGPQAAKKWFETFGQADPYILVMYNNIQDGVDFARTGKPPGGGATH